MLHSSGANEFSRYAGIARVTCGVVSHTQLDGQGAAPVHNRPFAPGILSNQNYLPPEGSDKPFQPFFPGDDISSPERGPPCHSWACHLRPGSGSCSFFIIRDNQIPITPTHSNASPGAKRMAGIHEPKGKATDRVVRDNKLDKFTSFNRGQSR